MLTPVPRARIDPRLLAHLAPGEQVLWQGQPQASGFFGPAIVAAGAGLVVAGTLLALGLGGDMLTSGTRQLSAIACVLAGLVVLVRGWSRRDELWSYAVTDRRLLSVLGRRLIRSVAPSQLDRMGLNIRGNTVYWASLHENQTPSFDKSVLRGPDGKLVGFHGQHDPQAIKTMIEAWRLALSDRAGDEARAFAAAAPDGLRRIVHPATGLGIAVPPEWEVLVSTHREAPLKLFGHTVLPRFIQETAAVPYAPGAEWNRMQVRAAPEAGMTLVISEGPSTITPDSVRNDPWAALTGADVLRIDDDLEIGPFTGFGVVRRLPAGAGSGSGGALSAPAMHRQMWLQGAGLSLQLEGHAREDQADIQQAIEAMIASLELSGRPR